MGFRAGQAGTQFTFFAGFRPTRGTTNRQGQFLLDFHGLHHAPLPAQKLVNSDQCFEQDADILEQEKS